MAHIILAVSEWDRCREFYEALLPFLGLKRVFSGQDSIYYVGGRTAVGVGRCDERYAADRFFQGSVGAGVLFGSVRRPGWNAASGQLCPREGGSRSRGRL